jgi:hypothetical protein
VEFLQVPLSVLGQPLDVLVKLIEVSILLLDGISQLLVLWNIVVSSVLDGFLESIVLLSNSLLLISLLLNHLLHLSHLLLKLVDILIILSLLVLHLPLRLGPDIISFS